MSNKERRKAEVSALSNIIKDCAIYDAEKTIAELKMQRDQLLTALHAFVLAYGNCVNNPEDSNNFEIMDAAHELAVMTLQNGKMQS